jgi:hypothetical protein
LSRFRFAEEVPLALGPLENADGVAVGELTSISPLAHGGKRWALGYLKRGAEDGFFRAADRTVYQAKIV